MTAWNSFHKDRISTSLVWSTDKTKPKANFLDNQELDVKLDNTPKGDTSSPV